MTEAIAVLFSVDPDNTKDYSIDVFRESDSTEDSLDPITRAEGLMESCRSDFSSTRLWTVTGNEQARELHKKWILSRLGMHD